MWAIKKFDFNTKAASEHRLFHRHKLDEFRLSSYENASVYKEKTRQWHDKKLRDKTFKEEI